VPPFLGKYPIKGVLGAGGAGTVYDAWDPGFERRVAIKAIRLPSDGDPGAADELESLRRERRAAGMLVHPNIVPAYDYLEIDGQACIVMEFQGGGDLRKLMVQGRRMPLPDAHRLMRQLLAGLQHSHDKDIVHRDLKPANLLLASEGTLKIADFGLARIGGHKRTMSGVIRGTPHFMSPEQWHGAADIGPATDIYACGVILYRMLTGRFPFDGTTPEAIMSAALRDALRPPGALVPALPPEFDAIVTRAMAREPSQRYPSAAAFAQDLQRASESRGHARPGARPRPARPRAAAWKRAAALAAAVSAGLCLALFLSGALSSRTLRDTCRDGAICPEMALVQADRFPFQMGTTEEEHRREAVPRETAAHESPRRPVRLGRDFYMALYPVTVAEYRAFARTNPPRPGSYCSWDKPGFAQTDRDPVVCVTYEDARAYVDWLNTKTGSNRYRLPTEAEWEYAARGGQDTARFWDRTGKAACDFANVADAAWEKAYPQLRGKQVFPCDDGYAQTAPVGQGRKPNAFGLYDMLGNVWQWTGECWHDNYKELGPDGTFPATPYCHSRVLRGGAWSDGLRDVRAGARYDRPVSERNSDMGFRLARSP
jgi:hypothetical protein